MNRPSINASLGALWFVFTLFASVLGATGGDALAQGARAVQPADGVKGTLVVSEYADVRVHTYVSPPDGFLVNTHIVAGWRCLFATPLAIAPVSATMK